LADDFAIDPRWLARQREIIDADHVRCQFLGHPRSGETGAEGKIATMAAARVLIIGGGIGGLCTAIALRRCGIGAQVFEQADALREVGAGLTIWTNAAKVLRRLDVADQVMSCASITERFQLRTWRGEILDETRPGDLGRRFGCPNLVVHRADVLRALASAVSPEAITVGATCVGFEQDSEGVTARFADGSEQHGEVLIGADGLHSSIRGRLIGDGRPRYAGYICWRGLAEIQGQDLPAGLGFEAWGRGARFAVQHCGSGRVFWYATRNAREGVPDGPRGRKQDVLDTFSGWHEPIPTVIAATDAGAILKNDITDREPIRHWGRGRVTLLGDAAHPMTPNFGQGACQAMEDAVVLADCLAGTSDVSASLRTYEARRRDRTAMITQASRRFGEASQWENPCLCWLRKLITKSGLARQYALKQLEDMLGYEVPTSGGA
jgi:2-polyprenyl-6-methoxyphenol hydroxylase-like FAD-dependent oxidoreductase